MLRRRVRAFCLMATAWGGASLTQETAAAGVGLTTDEFRMPMTAEPEAKAQDSYFLPGMATPPAELPLAEQDVLVEANNEAEPSEAEVEELASKVFALAAAYPTETRQGTRTTLIGLVGLMLFLALHMVVQHRREAPLTEDIFFKNDTGRITFSGAGSIVSLVLFVAGLAEMILGPRLLKNRNAKFDFSLPARGSLQTSAGRYLILMSTVAIVFGWLVGAPILVMELATTGFLVGSALGALGLALLFSDMKRGVDLAKKLYAFDLNDASAMSNDAQVDPTALIQLIDRSLQDNKGLEGFLAKKGVPLVEAFMSGAAQPGSGEPQQQGVMLDASTIAAVALQLQQLQKLQQQQQQQPATPQDVQLRNLFNAVFQAAQELQQRPEILQQASQLLGQLPTMPVGAAAASGMANEVPLGEAVPAKLDDTSDLG